MATHKRRTRGGGVTRLALEVCARTVVTQAELGRLLGRSRGNVSTQIKTLRAAGILDDETTNLRGIEHIQLDRDLALLAGIDFGRDEARLMVADARHRRRLYKPVIESDISLEHEPVVAINRVTQRLLRELDGIDGAHERPVAVALSVPAPVDRERQTAASPEILGNLHKLAPRDMVCDLLTSRGYDAHVTVANDASLGALGLQLLEVLADGRPPARALVYVKVAEGIGCGITINGELFDGDRGLAGEFGHFKVTDFGDLCPNCGGVGCLETIASNRAIVDHVKSSRVFGEDEEVTIADVIDSEHRACARALRDAGWQIGVALSHVVNLLNPSRVVIGGEASRSAHFLSFIDHALERDVLAPIREAQYPLDDENGEGSNGEGRKAKNGKRPRPLTAEAANPRALSPELAGALAYAGTSILPDLITDRLATYLEGSEDEIPGK